MKIIQWIVVVVVALLCLAAGLAKLMQAPGEMAFLQGVGLTPLLITAMGALQVAGGVLLLLPKTQRIGALLALATLALSSVFLLMSGNLAFGLVSFIPAAGAGFLVLRPIGPRPSAESDDA